MTLHKTLFCDSGFVFLIGISMDAMAEVLSQPGIQFNVPRPSVDVFVISCWLD